MAGVPGVLGDLLSRAGSEAVGFGVGTALSQSLAPEAQGLAQDSYHLNPLLVTPPDVLAQLVIRGELDIDTAAGEATYSGFNGERFSNLVDALRVPTTAEQTLELYNRGKLSDEQARAALAEAGVNERYIAPVMDLARELLQAADLANARQQGFVTDDEQRTRSALVGIEPDDADLLFELAGLPPGIETGLELLRRGKIDEARFAQYVREGHTKVKYVDDLLELRYLPLSASVAAEALIRQRIPQDEAVKIAAENGINEADFLLWSNMLGRPIAIGEALTLARRGEFTFEEFTDAVARSDVRTEFAPDLWKLRTVYPPLFQLVRLISAGSITDELALEYAQKLGYTAELAHAIVDGGKKSKTSGTRKLAATQIDELYESGLETKEWALNALTTYGYSQDEAALHLELLDAKRLIAAVQSAVSLTHKQFVARKIEEAAAEQRLIDIGVQSPARDLLLESWGHEREATMIALTNAQIGRALKYDVITVTEAISRWVVNGYIESDAAILAALAGHPQTGSDSTAP